MNSFWLLLFIVDEIYLQKDAQYQGGKVVGIDSERNLFKSVMTFMINSLKQSHFSLKQYPR